MVALVSNIGRYSGVGSLLDDVGSGWQGALRGVPCGGQGLRLGVCDHLPWAGRQ